MPTPGKRPQPYQLAHMLNCPLDPPDWGSRGMESESFDNAAAAYARLSALIAEGEHAWVIWHDGIGWAEIPLTDLERHALEETATA